MSNLPNTHFYLHPSVHLNFQVHPDDLIMISVQVTRWPQVIAQSGQGPPPMTTAHVGDCCHWRRLPSKNAIIHPLWVLFD
eukprot:scaffold4653_cov145-Skeletonema_marinoi.AAC.3